MAHLPPRLHGKVAIVTGGAVGIGAAISRAIIRHGGRVVIGTRDVAAQGDPFVAELGFGAVAVRLRVGEADDWAAAVDVATKSFGRLNVLINNAGLINFGSLARYRREQWDQIIDANLTGPFLGVQASSTALVASAPSSIVNIASTAGMEGTAELHGYTASKYGLRGLTKSLALELGPHGVRANSVHPGIIDTRMTSGLKIPREMLGALGRAGRPEEVADLVVYLASDESSYSTGSEFIVDGGHLAGAIPTR